METQNMIFFNPGPSKVYDQMGQYLQDAFQQGILSINHRSSEFTAFSKKAVDLMHEKLDIPQDYKILFTSSATESWEIIAQSLTIQKSLHFYNGDFGKKWFELASKIKSQSVGSAFDLQIRPNVAAFESHQDSDVLCFTLNETSTGTQIPASDLENYRSLFPNALLALDTTSCLGGIEINWSISDIVYGSVQKCFGMPAGLGLLILSPKAITRAEQLGEKSFYNSVLPMLDKMKDFQTSYTPNVLGIYLLSRVLEKLEPISSIQQRLIQQMTNWENLIPKIPGLSVFVQDSSLRSKTVLTVGASPENVDRFKKEAKKAGITLGGGYGHLKNDTFRIANFPAITALEIEKLEDFLKKM